MTFREADSGKPADSRQGHRSRLRERFLAGGGAAVSAYELLELFLFNAKPRGDVKPLAKELIRRFGGFAGVMRADAASLAAVPDAGDSVATAIRAVSESAVLMLRQETRGRPILQSWTALLDYCRLTLADRKVEEFHLLFLDKSNALIADEAQGVGTVDQTAVYPREVVRRALELSASALILVHNHPSGSPAPSKEDIAMTKAIVEAARNFDIRVHDHLIVARDGHYSFKSQGLL